eukprot:scaffold172613_cov23-Tisochrysis_lutea.AAC.4
MNERHTSRCELAPTALELAVGAHRLLQHPPDPVGECVDRAQLGGGRLRCAGGSGVRMAVREVRGWRDSLLLGDPIWPRSAGEPAVRQLRFRELRADPDLVGVPVSDEQSDSVRVGPLEPDERARDADGPPDGAALVNSIAPKDKGPAVAQRQLKGPVCEGRRREEAEGFARVHKAEEVLEVALDV